MKMDPLVKIQSAKDLFWQREGEGILFLKPATGETALLSGFEAELWEWLSFMSWAHVVALSAAFLQVSKEQAEDQIEAVMRFWVRSGWIEISEEGE